jgi:tetratricopeptide (TPR) repeat protein
VSAGDRIAQLLERARRLESTGEDEPAKAAYLELLHLDPTHWAALNELGTLAWATGYRSAARTAYRQAVKCHPDNAVGRVNLANVLYQMDDLAGARIQYEAALAADADLPEAHQGLARTLTELGEARAAEPHWQRGFVGHASVKQRYRGTGTPLPALLLVSVFRGNVATRPYLDERVFEVVALYAEFCEPAEELPPHALVFNAIGDADLCPLALERAEALVARSTAPVINPPERVRLTGRTENARRFASIPGVVAPAIQRVRRAGLQNLELAFPVLLRAPGFHTGEHFLRVERRDELQEAIAALPGEELLAIEYLDARGTDGLARKYRVMFIDGALYPLHLAISPGWKVHYFSSDMAASVAHREEERRFLEDMPGVLGPRAMSALERISRELGLDYAGIDFGLGPDGSVLLFEANAAMVILPPDPAPMWEYRRAPIQRASEAVKRMLIARAAARPSVSVP